MKQDKEITKVVFRKFKGGDIIALFPEVQYNNDKDLCMSYQHIGQHGAASYRLIDDTILAKPEEYSDLAKELEDIGYNLKIQKKINKRWY